jgi:hypothetical protein
MAICHCEEGFSPTKQSPFEQEIATPPAYGGSQHLHRHAHRPGPCGRCQGVQV